MLIITGKTPGATLYSNLMKVICCMNIYLYSVSMHLQMCLYYDIFRRYIAVVPMNF